MEKMINNPESPMQRYQAKSSSKLGSTFGSCNVKSQFTYKQRVFEPYADQRRAQSRNFATRGGRRGISMTQSNMQYYSPAQMLTNHQMYTGMSSVASAVNTRMMKAIINNKAE